jgi:hypothetical protein
MQLGEGVNYVTVSSYSEGVWKFWVYELLSYRNIGIGRPTAHLMLDMETSFGLIENDFTNEIGISEHLS